MNTLETGLKEAEKERAAALEDVEAAERSRKAVADGR